MIRLYDPTDNRQLASLHNLVFPERTHTPSSFGEYVAGTRALGGFVWVIEDSSLAGYGSVTPVPGLAGIAELDGCIAAERRRQGLGSRLLTGILDGLRNTTIRQVTFAVESLAGPCGLVFPETPFLCGT
jgi:L-amino acid N-acyltransferase YncA